MAPRRKEPEHADVIVVGAGSAGCVLAARLSEDAERSVMLLDEGPDLGGAEDLPARVQDPDTVPSASSDAEWTRWGEVALGGGRSTSLPRGRLVGGSGAVNGAYFVRSTAEDLRTWEAAAGPEWSPEAMLATYCRAERDLDLGDRDGHGGDGPVPVVRAAEDALHPVSVAVLGAAETLGLPHLEDLNAPGAGTGAGVVPRNLADRRRASTALTHLDPARERSNLSVHAGVRVRRVVVEHGRAIGVEVDSGRAARIVRGDLVVLCAGAVTSAQLLLLSGIGPAEHLLAQGIEVVVDAPGVGTLRDHPAIELFWTPRAAHGGRGVPPLFEVAAHLDTGTDRDRADGDVELLAMTRSYGVASGEDPSDRRLSLRVGVQRTVGTGTVRLDSATPHTPPLVHQAHLRDPADLARAVHGVRAAMDLLHTGALAELVEQVHGPGADDLDSTHALGEWVLAHAGTSLHPSGTCAMGPADEPRAVVDPHGRVRGVEGLVVADTSIIPVPISRGPAATAVAIGERIAELIRSDEASGSR